MKALRKTLLAALTTLASACPAYAQDSLKGLGGLELKRAAGRMSMPQRLIETYEGAESVWEVLWRCEGTPQRGLLNRFSADELALGPEGAMPPKANLANVVDEKWWKVERGDCRHRARYDLYNRYPCLTEVIGLKEDFPPGTVTRPTYDNGLWSVGTGFLNGAEAWLWQPPKGYEGDVARVLMYMVTAYWDGLSMNGPGSSFLSLAEWPGLNEGAARQLLAWHRQDPVSDLELRRNAEIGSAQGNRNPFVDYPGIAEYLWGEHKGEPYQESEDSGEEADEKEPLRGFYTLEDDRINLRAPYVPPSARWAVNGKPVEGEYLVPAQLGTGKHTLSFTGEGTHGYIIIEIR